MIPTRLIKKQQLVLLVLAALILLTALIGMGLGSAPLSYKRLFSVILGQGTFKENFILFSIRLPRLVITILAGIALAVSGAILQGMTRNDLADPGIIGIHSGAGVAIAVFFLFFPIETGSFVYLLPVVAFAGAFLTAGLIYVFSIRRGSGLQPIRIILTGIGFSMALSGMMVVLVSSGDRQKVDFIARWMSGNIWGTDWPFIIALVPWLVILIPYTLFKARRLNLLSLDDTVSAGLGVSMGRERLTLLIAATALASAAVSVTGGIAFIGLMAPHMARALIGPRHQLLIPIAALIGGWLLMMADTIGRNLAEPDGIPAGIVTALIGAPYFLYLLRKKV
ncbi:iron complex transport system permease protein [Scopulibacillus daqui]|uniref:Iron complex transport system permease protein n=1 Tax=Scopulibacillus daqui TaxID=1469162 RepID=A0ABS2PX37_9BACL|nr:iron ABC transporter permease [Scopulibacillus daqui]MBM7644528.1 iron complex transport system permease protein [Scopulibacillus daqui]